MRIFIIGFLSIWFGTADASSIAIMATGQSNDVRILSYNWAPNRRATAWNNVIGMDGSIGTALAPLSPTTTNVTWKFASDIARQNPGHDVCLLTVAFPGESIGHWLSGYGGYPTVSPDIYGNITANVGSWLSACGATKIDYLVWWQGDADTSNPNYASTDFPTMMARFGAETWFSPSVQVLIFGLASSAISGNPNGDAMNVTLRSLANSDLRQFVPIAPFPSAYWDGTLPGHMNGAGYDAAGALAANVAADVGYGWTPYSVTLGCGSGGPVTGNPVGAYKLLPGKIVEYRVFSNITNYGTCGIFLKATLPPFPMSTNSPYTALAGFDVSTGSVETGAMGSIDPGAVHIFSAAGGFPAGSPIVSGSYERQ